MCGWASLPREHFCVLQVTESSSVLQQCTFGHHIMLPYSTMRILVPEFLGGRTDSLAFISVSLTDRQVSRGYMLRNTPGTSLGSGMDMHMPPSPMAQPSYLWHSHQDTAIWGYCWAGLEPSTGLASLGRHGRSHSRCHLSGSEWCCSHGPVHQRNILRMWQTPAAQGTCPSEWKMKQFAMSPQL